MLFPTRSLRRNAKRVIFVFVALGIILFGATVLSMHPVISDFQTLRDNMPVQGLQDRNGTSLTVTYHGRWNGSDMTSLHDVPSLMKSGFLLSEDADFYSHHGIDWQARAAALWQNIKGGDVVRGASTITEQTVRMMYPRPRNIWSKWVEGCEAAYLETGVSKANIFEFYLNQIPYASNRRGVTQAARYYFNRDISTLSPRETLALIVLARAPSSYDLYRDPNRITKAVERLASRMEAEKLIDGDLYRQVLNTPLNLEGPRRQIYAQHFARYVRQNSPSVRRSSIDSSLQMQVQDIIDQRLAALSHRHVQNAGAIVVDVETGHILAWVVGGAGHPLTDVPAGDIDTVVTPRQPGSAMKPFLYAAAIQKGWTGATMLNDAPLAESVGSGLHRFRNYSNTYHGQITLREALGNSLNIPALLTIRYVGVGEYLSLLQKMHFTSLTSSSDVYDEGLALGNGEVTLLEMATAYTALARHGEYRPLRLSVEDNIPLRTTTIFSDEATSILTNILADPWARRMEFGADSILNFPVPTAAKTGTSTDYRDAWVFGYNQKFVVGIWMGNLDRTPMVKVTGSTGPALAMRSIFSILNRNIESDPLHISPKLAWQDICIRPEKNGYCPMRSELFLGDIKNIEVFQDTKEDENAFQLVRPTEGLQIAYDPHIPSTHQKFRFELAGVKPMETVSWKLNGEQLGGGQLKKDDKVTYLWPVERGDYVLSVAIHNSRTGQKENLTPVKFRVK